MEVALAGVGGELGATSFTLRPGTYAALDQSDSSVVDVYYEGSTVAMYCKTMNARRLQARLNKMDEDWSSNMMSWRNEAAFYNAAPTAVLKEHRVRVPRVYKVWEDRAVDPCDASFTFLLEMVEHK